MGKVTGPVLASSTKSQPRPPNPGRQKHSEVVQAVPFLARLRSQVVQAAPVLAKRPNSQVVQAVPVLAKRHSRPSTRDVFDESKVLLKNPDIHVSLMGTQRAKESVLQAMLSASSNNTKTIQNEVEVYGFRLSETLSVSIANLSTFEDDNIEDNLSKCETLFNFFRHHKPGTCSGVIMAYDLSRHRLHHCDLLNFRLVKDLCGSRFLEDRLVIFTTNWLSEPQADLARLESRESDIRNLKEDCFLQGGARYHRHNLPESASMVDLIGELAAHPALPLTIQEEVSNDLPFNETTIGGALAERLREDREMMQKRLDSLAVNLENLRTECWDTNERDAMQKDLEALEVTLARLDKIVVEGFS